MTESLRKPFGFRAYRCRDCGWRGIVHAHDTRGTKSTILKSYTFAITFSIVVIALLVLINLHPEILENIVKLVIGMTK